MENNNYRMPQQSPTEPPIGEGQSSSFAEFASSLAAVDPPQPKRSLVNKKFIAFIIACFVLIGGGTSAVFAVDYFTKPLCLTSSDYKLFAGHDYSDTSLTLDPSSALYTYTVSYQPGTVDYLDSSKTPTANLIKQLGSFAANHPDKPFTVYITSVYQRVDDESLVKDRGQALVSALKSAGVPDDSITLVAPSYTAPESDVGIDTDPVTTLSISSPQSCR